MCLGKVSREQAPVPGGHPEQSRFIYDRAVLAKSPGLTLCFANPTMNRLDRGVARKPPKSRLSLCNRVLLLSGNHLVCLLSYPCLLLLRLSLEVMTILCRCENIETSEGVPLYVTGVAQVNDSPTSHVLSLTFFSPFCPTQQQQWQQEDLSTLLFL